MYYMCMCACVIVVASSMALYVYREMLIFMKMVIDQEKSDYCNIDVSHNISMLMYGYSNSCR